jgi:zinc protease
VRAARPTAGAPPAHADHWQKSDEVPLPRIYLAWHTPPLFAPGDAELDLFSSVLTAGKTSRLYHPLVYDQTVAKDVNAYQASEQLSSYYVIEATAAPGQSVDALYAALAQAFSKALGTPPSADELERATSAYKKQFYRRIEAVQSRASTLATYYQHTGRADYLGDDLARYVEATAQGVHDAARRYLSLNEAVRLDIVPGKKEQLTPEPAAQVPAASAAGSAPRSSPPRGTPSTRSPAQSGSPAKAAPSTGGAQ